MTQSITQDVHAAAAWEEDERTLLQAARRNPADFGRVYDRYVRPLYGYLLSKTGNVAEAEDLTSQTFLCALERLSEYRHQGHFSAWLFRIAHNKWVDFYRRKKRPLPEGSWPSSELCDDVLQQVIQGERAQLLATLVHRLGEDERELLRLRLVAELSFAEIADYLGKNEPAAKKAYYRLIERMKNEMEQVYG